MTARPQVLTLTAGNATVTLDTATVARALDTLRMSVWAPMPDAAALDTLYDALRDVCGPDHLDAVRHVRVGDPSTTTTTTTTED